MISAPDESSCSDKMSDEKRAQETAQRKQILTDWIKKWDLGVNEAAHVLGVSSGNMSSYLSATSSSRPNKSVMRHIDTFSYLSESKAKSLIKKRIKEYKTKGTKSTKR